MDPGNWHGVHTAPASEKVARRRGGRKLFMKLSIPRIQSEWLRRGAARWSAAETRENWMGKCLRVNGERNIWIRNQIQGRCGRLKLHSLLSGHLIPARHDYCHNSHAQPSVARFMAQSFILTLNLTLYEKNNHKNMQVVHRGARAATPECTFPGERGGETRGNQIQH